MERQNLVLIIALVAISIVLAFLIELGAFVG
jgi:hypothetical protein